MAVSTDNATTTIVKNYGTAQESVVTQTAKPMQPFSLSSVATPTDIVRAFNGFVAAVKEATLASRSLPFGGPKVYIEAVSFTNGAAMRIPHRLGTDRVRVWLGHKTAAGDVVVNDVTDTLVTVTPTATFTADVLFMVVP